MKYIALHRCHHNTFIITVACHYANNHSHFHHQVIRRCIDINFDSSKHVGVAADVDSDEDDDDEQIEFEVDSQFNKKHVFHYRIIVPPIHPGSRRNFRDYDELPNEDGLELVELPPSGSFMDNLRGSPFTKARSPQTRRHSKQLKRRSKSQQNFATNKTLNEIEVPNGIESMLADGLDSLSINATATSGNDEKGKTSRPTTTAVEATKTHSRTRSHSALEKSSDENSSRENDVTFHQNSNLNSEGEKHRDQNSQNDNKNKAGFLNLPETQAPLSRARSAEGIRKHRLVARRLSVDDRERRNTKSRKHSSEDNTRKKSETKNEKDSLQTTETSLDVDQLGKRPISPKLLPRRKSMDEGIKIHVSKPEDDLSDELGEEFRDYLTAETLDLELLPEDVCWTQMISRTTLPTHEDSSHIKKPSRRRSEVHFKSSVHFPKQCDETSIASFASHRKRTDSFNSSANSQLMVKSRRRSTASQLGADVERRHRKMSNNEVIYDARPDKALSKGYSTMQMTIGGKQVKICVPKFSKDDVIDRARAKSAAQMADDRTRVHHTTKKHKQIK